MTSGQSSSPVSFRIEGLQVDGLDELRRRLDGLERTLVALQKALAARGIDVGDEVGAASGISLEIR